MASSSGPNRMLEVKSFPGPIMNGRVCVVVLVYESVPWPLHVSKTSDVNTIVCNPKLSGLITSQTSYRYHTLSCFVHCCRHFRLRTKATSAKSNKELILERVAHFQHFFKNRTKKAVTFDTGQHSIDCFAYDVTRSSIALRSKNIIGGALPGVLVYACTFTLFDFSAKQCQTRWCGNFGLGMRLCEK